MANLARQIDPDRDPLEQLFERVAAIEERLGVLERVETLLVKVEPLLDRYLNNPAARFTRRARTGGT